MECLLEGSSKPVRTQVSAIIYLVLNRRRLLLSRRLGSQNLNKNQFSSVINTSLQVKCNALKNRKIIILNQSKDITSFEVTCVRAGFGATILFSNHEGV